ncbi:glycosyltransferase [Oceaniglobus roseus]|uniref:glycosyltransferase n=1 Tax=Oceaniglobus roseus TaxID=1737570 RepID=UPI000C7F3E4D|nr:glycosyltransferase [Kandeliimicrobium roseum]
MSGAPHVRILMCTCNGAPWLEAQLASFVAQTHGAWSLWVSDDGSTDATRSLLEAFDRARPGRIERIVEGPRAGSAANYMHLLCHPDLPPGPVALSDQDDVWMADKLARAIAALGGPRAADSAAQPAAWGARWIVTDEHLSNPRPSTRFPRGPSFGNALVQNVLSGHSATLNAAALALVRRAGPQPVAHHDWWLYQLLAGSGADLVLDEAPALYYRQHGRNVLGANRGWSAMLARLGQVRGGSFTDWTRTHRVALGRVAPLLTPAARGLLAALDAAPPRGLGRIRAFRRLGLVRQTRTGTALLHLLAGQGRI